MARVLIEWISPQLREIKLVHIVLTSFSNRKHCYVCSQKKTLTRYKKMYDTDQINLFREIRRIRHVLEKSYTNTYTHIYPSTSPSYSEDIYR